MYFLSLQFQDMNHQNQQCEFAIGSRTANFEWEILMTNENLTTTVDFNLDC